MHALRAVTEALCNLDRIDDVPSTTRRILASHPYMCAHVHEAFGAIQEVLPCGHEATGAILVEVRHSFAAAASLGKAKRLPQNTSKPQSSSGKHDTDTPSATGVFVQRIRVAVYDKQLDDALDIIAEMASSGITVPSGGLVDTLRLSREAGRYSVFSSLTCTVFTTESVAFSARLVCACP